jgi:hypothetical protein
MMVSNRIFGVVLVSLLVSLGTLIPGIGFAASSIDFGGAENFTLLAKSGISATGTVAISGDVGVSPSGASSFVGFLPILDASNEFASSALVGGKLYAADYTTPTKITKATIDMETAYNDASSRSFPAATGRANGEIGGLTFTPGLYKWNTAINILSDITLSGGAEDVWIFQIGENLNVASQVKIFLTDGALSKNIFWQVSGQTTLGADSVFNGNILSKTSIVFNTGAVLNGRAFSQAAILLNSNVITKPGLSVFVPLVLSPTPAAVVPQPVTSSGTSTPLLVPMPPIATTSVPVVQPIKPSWNITRHLFLGLRGNDVSALQLFLILKKIGPEAEKLSSVGTTGYFGTLTKKALAEFQKSVGITPAAGYFGPKTLGYINSLN